MKDDAMKFTERRTLHLIYPFLELYCSASAAEACQSNLRKILDRVLLMLEVP